MAELPNACRSQWRATYTPIKDPATPNGAASNGPITRALAKRAFIAALRPTAVEHSALLKLLAPLSSEISLALGAFHAVAKERSPAAIKRSTQLVANVAIEALVTVARALVDYRAGHLRSIEAAHQRVWAEYQRRVRRSTVTAPFALADGWQLVEAAASALGPVYRRTRSENRAGGPSGGVTPLGHEIREAIANVPEPADETARLPRVVSLAVLLDWASANGVETAAVAATRDFLGVADRRPHDLTLATFDDVVDEYVGGQEELVDAFSDTVTPEPVGFLHLERLNYIPAAIERGELLHSVPLSPKETVNIAHKEWSQTSEEFANIVTDSLDDYAETGVTEKSELAQTTTSERKRDSNISTAVSMSGGYGPVSISASGSYSVATSATETEEKSRSNSMALTRKAASRAKKEHKVSFKVASAAGTEDQTIRRITNPFDRTTRIDYYRMIRTWRVNLYRYGVRMTYDLTIPEPGAELVGRIRELQEIRAFMEQGFDSPTATASWARFDLRPSEITRTNYLLLAAQYNASIEPPPLDAQWIDRTETKNWTSDEATHPQYFSIDLDVPQDYRVVRATQQHQGWKYDGAPYTLWLQDMADFVGKSGTVSLVYNVRQVAALYLEVRLELKLRDEAFDRWRMKAWTTIRDAAQARYYETRQLLKERLDRLTADLGAQDALGLRKLERDEIMKGVLRWLLGPSFQFNPIGVGAELYGASGSINDDQLWIRVGTFGEMIKFLHQAIEWENVLFFLYPYFWSHRSRWDLKKSLDHPDVEHRAFLKAGSARVVLTVRPGFERAFAEFVENGGTGPLANSHPYVTIAEEMESFARTNYPGIPAANPDDAATRELGNLIGTWFEYTPTSALDIAFDDAQPTA